MLLYLGGESRIDFLVMRRLYKLRMTKKFMFTLYLALSLLFVQWAQFHIHIYNNDPVTSDHNHLNQVHYMYDASDAVHHDKIADIDLAQEGLITKILLGLLFVAIFTTIFILLLPRLCISFTRRYKICTPFIPWSNPQPPPLRAPPL